MGEGIGEVEVPADTWREVRLWAKWKRMEPEDLLAEAWREYYERRAQEQT